MDLSLLQTLEREKILQVLQRDRMLRTIEEERIRRMKQELQEIRRRGAKSLSRQYSERTCARCQRPLGKFWNSGDVCCGCSHRICSRCRVGGTTSSHWVTAPMPEWRCTVCHAYRDIRVRSGEWFLEETAKKFPITTGRHDTVGEKLLKSYSMLSNISIVPPTPPPYLDCPIFCRSGDPLTHSAFFTKSVEDLMVSFTSQIKKISKSQNDVRSDQADKLTVGNPTPMSPSNYTGQKSLSDTDIKSLHLTRGHSMSSLLHWSKDNQDGMSPGSDADLSLWASGTCSGKRGSTSSIVSVDCGASGSSRSVTGALELALAYHNTTSCLQVTVRGCQNVSYGNAKKKKCNPYVKIYLETDKAQASKRKTSVKRNTTDPVYNEVLQYQIERHLLSACTLRASVWHSGSLKRKVFLGETLVPLKAWSSEEMTVAWYPLCSKRPVAPEGGTVEQVKAEMHISLKLGPTCETSSICQTHGVDIGSQGYHRLTVLIKGVKNLPIKANTSQNMDVKGCLTLSRGRKVLSSNLRNGACSDSAQLLFDGLSRSELADCVLVLDVWDHTHLSLTDRPLGGARLDANKTGLPWQTVLQATNKWHDFSLPLVTNVSSRRT
ncbi:unnamed protein product [Gadus morhua 'NCC']